MKTKTIAFLFLPLLLMPLLLMSVAEAQYKMPRSVLGSGYVMQDGAQYQMRGTLGQPAIGPSKCMSFAGFAGFWYTPDNVTVGVDAVAEAFPEDIRIETIYPNPLRSSAVLKYSVAHSSTVRLSVYDMFGREVARLIEGNLDPGRYTFTWNAEDIRSGVYILQLRSGSSVQLRKIAIVR